MIFDKLENAGAYKGISAGLDKALNFLEGGAEGAEPGKVLELGDGVLVRCFAYRSNPASEGLSEAHRAFIDVMYMRSGSEHIGYKYAGDLKNITQEYNPENDALLAKDDDLTLLPFSEGSFAVFFPQDAHMGGVSAGELQNVVRVVVKVPVDD